MSNRLGGKQGTAYLGTNANQPPNWVFSDRDPNQYDINNVVLGDMWLNQVDKSVWILVSLAGNSDSLGSLATWVSLANDTFGALSTLEGNTGGLVGGDGSANIDLVGDGVGITITGNPGSHTLTASLVGGGAAAQSFPTDNGIATPIAGVVNIQADTASVNAGSSVSFSGAANAVTLNVTDANNNTIIGSAAGNTLVSGGDNTILGKSSGMALTSGSDNTMIGQGSGSLITTGSDNILLGSDSGSALTGNNSNNTLIGLPGFSGASEFIAIAAGNGGTPNFHNFPGVNASTSNGGNIFIGGNSGNFTLAGAAGDASNVGVGAGTLNSLTTGARNNAMGTFSLSKVTTGANNTALGHNAAFDSVGDTGLTSGSFNIIIGADAGDNYIAAESSNIIIGNLGVVGESNTVRIGTTGTGDSEQDRFFVAGVHGTTPDTADGIPVYIGSDGQLGTVGSGGSTFTSTLTADSGGPVSPTAGNINIVGDGSTIQITGNPGTSTLTVVALGGGTVATIDGDTGSVTPMAGTINIIADNASQGAGASVIFTGSTDTLTLTVTDTDANTLIGEQCGNGTLSGTDNTGLGYTTLLGLTTGSGNVCIGNSAGNLITSGLLNVAIGSGSASALLTGTSNSIIGAAAGSAYTGTESSNILINSTGVVGESNILRFGAGTGVALNEINKAFISGIVGITPDTADGVPVFIGSDGQLGTVGTGGTTMVQTITGNSGGAVGPSAGNINFVGDGVTVNITGNPGTNTLTVVGLGGGGGDLSQLDADSGFALPAAGVINIITDNAGVNAGSSVLFTGSSDTILLDVTDSSNNTLIGSLAGNLTLTGTNNVGLGDGSLSSLTTGSFNTSNGSLSGDSFTTGSYNALLGYNAGSNYTTSESSNILLNASGTAAESNVLRIGSGTGSGNQQLNKAFINGIYGVTPDTADGIPLFMGSAGQLGTVGSGGTTMVQTITGNSGGAVGPASGNINIVGDGSTINITGNPGTNTLTITGLGGGTVSQLTGDSGIATAAAGNINVIAGNSTQNCGSSVLFSGTGGTLTLDVTDANNNTIIGADCGNATLTGLGNTILGTDCGSSLTSGSSNVFIGYQAGNLVTSGTGNFLCGDASLNAVLQGTTTSTGLYALGASTGLLFMHNWGGFASGNTFAGYSSGSSFNAGQQASSKNNSGFGTRSLEALTTGVNNTGLGNSAGDSVTTGVNNTLVGNSAGDSITTGSNNTAVGDSAGDTVETGSHNTFLGDRAGRNHTGSDSSNICIGRSTVGTAGQSNTMRIGVGTGTGTGQINRTFISGIRGITTGISNAIPVVIDSAGQLGTAGGGSVTTSLTGNTGGAVSATAGNINIVGDGVSVNVAGNPGTSTLTISAVGGAGGPSFMVYRTNTIPNATTSNVLYKFIYDTVGNNSGGAFNLGTSTFTAPVTGLYNFSCNVGMQFNSAVTKRIQVYLTTTSRNYSLIQHNISNGNYSLEYSVSPEPLNVLTLPGGSVYAPMTAGDTAILTTIINSGSATASILGTSLESSPVAIRNFFSGTLV